MIAEAAGLTFTYREEDHPALAPISFEIPPETIVAATGPTSSGKTTLHRLLSGLAPSVFDGSMGGRAQLLGEPLPFVGGPPAGAGIFTDSPHTQLTGLRSTVAGEIAVTLENRGWDKERIRSRLDSLLRPLRLEPLAERSPTTLSGGELQRVLVAAALAHEPRVLIMDEPMVHLDPPTRRSLRQILLQQARDGQAIVLTTASEAEAEEAGAESMIRLQRESGTASEPVLSALEGLAPPPGSSELLVFGDVCFRYPGGIQAVLGANLRLRRGEVAGLVGGNGSGKTTLARLALGLLRPDSGRILVGGRDRKRSAPSRIARDVGLVFQNPSDQIFHGTIWKEVTFGPRLRGWEASKVDAAATRALEASGLLHLREDNPRELGWSKRRQLSLACMLATKPSLLILDEPTSGLDEDERRTVGDIAQRWAALGGGVLAVTHDLEWAARNCHYLMRMDMGVLEGPSSNETDPGPGVTTV